MTATDGTYLAQIRLSWNVIADADLYVISRGTQANGSDRAQRGTINRVPNDVGGFDPSGSSSLDLVADLSALDRRFCSMPWHGRILFKKALVRTLFQSRDTVVISEATVRLHVSNILAKLGAANRTEAAIIALQHKLKL